MMTLIHELLPYIRVFLALVSVVLAFILASSIKGLMGKRWLVAYTVFSLVTSPVALSLAIVVKTARDPLAVSYWFEVLQLLSLFSVACMGIFLFVNWMRSRMKIDIKNLLFSFSGRIPRSALWIMVCIFFPLGFMVGNFAASGKAQGLPKMIIWTIYGVWSLVSIWISLAVYAKRWHDCGKSGWMSLVLLIPIIGPFWFWICQGFIKGTAGPNKYGEDPLVSRPPAA